LATHSKVISKIIQYTTLFSMLFFILNFKEANNVSTTGSTDAEFVITELKASLARIGMDCSQKGYNSYTIKCNI
jgi:hypothetical protein